MYCQYIQGIWQVPVCRMDVLSTTQGAQKERSGLAGLKPPLSLRISQWELPLGPDFSIPGRSWLDTFNTVLGTRQGKHCKVHKSRSRPLLKVLDASSKDQAMTLGVDDKEEDHSHMEGTGYQYKHHRGPCGRDCWLPVWRPSFLPSPLLTKSEVPPRPKERVLTCGRQLCYSHFSCRDTVRCVPPFWFMCHKEGSTGRGIWEDVLYPLDGAQGEHIPISFCLWSWLSTSDSWDWAIILWPWGLTKRINQCVVKAEKKVRAHPGTWRWSPWINQVRNCLASRLLLMWDNVFCCGCCCSNYFYQFSVGQYHLLRP